MCQICGCEGEGGVVVRVGHAEEHVHADGTRHAHPHGSGHEHSHSHGHAGSEFAPGAAANVHSLEARIIEKNLALARKNRSWFEAKGIAAVNVMGAPGSGKTALLERTIREMKGGRPILVVEGDQATQNDGDRIRAAGAAVVQVNTGAGCHLDADMIALGVQELDPPPGCILIIENVGNLVCPALFDLGEMRRVAVLSCTEGDDKPLKYPHMFRTADLVVLNKIDLLPYVDFDIEAAERNADMMKADVDVIRLSARTGQGFDSWTAWLSALTSSPA